MPISIKEVSLYLSELLAYSKYPDGAVNGLQVEASEHVTKIGVAVDFAESIVEKAIAEKVDLLITHHGLLWGSTPPLTESTGRKVSLLFRNNINLIGAHIPLDAHETYGNNFILARDILLLDNLKSAIPHHGIDIGCMGENTKSSLNDLAEILKKVPGALEHPLVFNFGPKTPKKVCVVTGAACDTLYQFKEAGFDTLISGEPRQFAYHFCKEEKLNAIFAGHYATETFGVRALGSHLSGRYKVPWVFLDEPTGV